MSPLDIVRPPVVTAPPAAQTTAPPTPADRPQAPASRFADLLRRQSAAPPAVARDPSTASPPSTSAAARAAGDSTASDVPEGLGTADAGGMAMATSRRDMAQAKARSTTAPRAGATQAGTKADGTEATAASDDADAKRPASDTTGLPPAAATPPLRLDPPAARDGGATRGAAGNECGTGGAGDGAGSTPIDASATDAAAQGATTVDARDAAREATPSRHGETGRAIAGGSTPADSFVQRLAEASHGSGRGERAEMPPPAAAAGPGGSADVAAPAAPAAASVAVPVDAPEFAAAFGLSVSVLAQAGVEKAELHLNPADMGPVSIAIAIDGNEARVDFGADVAATRQAIEAGLPELASALRDAGFTLAGGGVSDQASRGDGRGGSDEPAGDPSPRRVAVSAAGRTAVDAAARARPWGSGAGGVDLYA